MMFPWWTFIKNTQKEGCCVCGKPSMKGKPEGCCEKHNPEKFFWCEGCKKWMPTYEWSLDIKYCNECFPKYSEGKNMSLWDIRMK